MKGATYDFYYLPVNHLVTAVPAVLTLQGDGLKPGTGCNACHPLQVKENTINQKGRTMLKVTIAIDKSFEDEIRILKKDYADGDISEFMRLESDYLENLVAITKEHGKPGNSFQVSFHVFVEVQ